jgi:hypothetical protein
MFNSMRSYVSARSRAQLVEVLLAMQIALWTLRLGGWVVVALAPSRALLALFLRGAALSSPILMLLFVATVVVFAAWLARAAANLPLLTGTRLDPTLVTLAVLTPGVNFLAVPHVVWRIWRGSDVTPPPQRRVQRIVFALWNPLLLALAIASFGLPRPWRVEGDAWLLVLQALLALVAAIAAVALVRDVQRRQDEQWVDRERQRMQPQPAADRLR